MKGKRAAAVAAGSILTVGILFAAIGLAPSATPAGSKGCGEFTRETRSDQPYHTTYDDIGNVVWADGPEGRLYRLDPADPSCKLPGRAKNLIDEALSIHDQVQAADCQGIKRILASGTMPTKNGRTLNRADAQRFVETECADQ